MYVRNERNELWFCVCFWRKFLFSAVGKSVSRYGHFRTNTMTSVPSKITLQSAADDRTMDSDK